ncbi:hypothetical protein ASPWEDRAFT_31927 [Aspergillus wentii DTO 134E9]|uniref:BTB domain-containing protein n=1 Tax=Aspergillus wentii DTO 134E9 TaxID=1073089 RepID=A0A1L9R8R1_ASPWE|nr:uncharacterized protein ASPWEDRAFT_31927 [Aspergillus wentii DTO 134E9]OJJ31268.1 hypothetical protein ASPWEDRAFT_31927 [Aspergillus wentii DTO 134E9]
MNTVTLRTSNSPHSFPIHKDLLKKCKPINAAFEKSFQEGQKGVYTCSDTCDGTLSCFIEWAYQGDYSIESSDTSTEGHDNPLLTHIEIYIFSDIYNVPSLKQLAFNKLQTSLADTGKPDDKPTQQAIMALIHTAFTRISPYDDILDWLAQYAAYCVDRLQQQPSFQDLLEDHPALASRMMHWLNPATAPWDNREERCVPQTSLTDGYCYYW